MRTRVLKFVTAAQECLDMRSGCHAAKILPVGFRGTKNVWCLSFLICRATSGIASFSFTLTLSLSSSVTSRQVFLFYFHS